MEQGPFNPEKAFSALLIIFTVMGCTQTMPEVAMDDVPVPVGCSLLNFNTLEEFEYKNQSPLQASYNCSLTVDEIYDFYETIGGWERAKSVKTEFLVALIFSRDFQDFKEILGITYTTFADENRLIVVKGYSEKVLDTGWV